MNRLPAAVMAVAIGYGVGFGSVEVFDNLGSSEMPYVQQCASRLGSTALEAVSMKEACGSYELDFPSRLVSDPTTGDHILSYTFPSASEFLRIEGPQARRHDNDMGVFIKLAGCTVGAMAAAASAKIVGAHNQQKKTKQHLVGNMGSSTPASVRGGK